MKFVATATGLPQTWFTTGVWCAWQRASTRKYSLTPPNAQTSGWAMSKARASSSERQPHRPNSASPPEMFTFSPVLNSR